MRKIVLGLVAATAVAAPIAFTASAANADVALDASGKGFIGKGAVQSAYGYSNGTMQTAVERGFAFRAEQPTSQPVAQSATQSGSQTGTQTGTESATQVGTQSATRVVSQDLSCTYTNGSDKNTKYFHREGVRGGERTGTRDGSRVGTREGVRDVERDGIRTGIRAGSLTGTLSADLNVTNKKTGQYTGFNLNGWTSSPAYTPAATMWNDSASFDAWEFGDWSFGAYSFTGGYGFGEYSFPDAYMWEPDAGIEWGDWVAAPGENPADCDRSQNADKITYYDSVVTDGTMTDGAITDGDITVNGVEDGAITDGTITEGRTEYGAQYPTGDRIPGTMSKVVVTDYRPISKTL